MRWPPSSNRSLPATSMRSGRPSQTTPPRLRRGTRTGRSEEHTSELQSLAYLVCRLLLEKKKHYAAFPLVTRETAVAAPPNVIISGGFKGWVVTDALGYLASSIVSWPLRRATFQHPVFLI